MKDTQALYFLSDHNDSFHDYIFKLHHDISILFHLYIIYKHMKQRMKHQCFIQIFFYLDLFLGETIHNKVKNIVLYISFWDIILFKMF